MKKEIIINAGANETRIAITEDGRLAELFVETANKEKMVGDIYFGKIAKVMPGIKAAFIDIGLGQDGFLHFSDIGNRFEEYSAMIGDEDEEGEEPKEPAVAEAPVESAVPPRSTARLPPPPHTTGDAGITIAPPPARTSSSKKGRRSLFRSRRNPSAKKGSA
jgi:Rne/Rng family ribonuclease